MPVQNDDAAVVRPRWRPIDRTAAVAFGALVAFHCVAVLGFVQSSGRLAVVPMYDDVSYFTEGLKRLSAFDNNGLLGLAESFGRNAPHAPYSDILAVLGFALTPASMLGGYVMNFVWIAVFATLAWRTVNGLSPAGRFGLLSATLSIPMLATAIGSFRPDVYWGLMTGGTAVILAVEGVAQATRKGVFVMGLLVGAAALTKPTGMPAGAVVMGVAYLGSVGIDLRVKRMTFGEAVRRTGLLLFGVSVIIMPYLVFGWHELLKYILDVMINDAGVWRTNGPISLHLMYFLRPVLATQWLGWMYYAALLLVVAAIALLWRTGHREEMAHGGTVLLAILVSYAIPTWSPVKISFFGSVFYGTILFAGLWSGAAIARNLRMPDIVIVTAGILVFLAAWKPGNDTISTVGPSYAAVDRATRAISPAVMNALESASERPAPPVVITTSPGPVLMATLGYDAAVRKLPGLFVDRFTDTNWDRVRAEVEAADIVLASENGADGQNRDFAFPMLSHQGDIVEVLSKDPAWHKIATYVDEHGFKTEAFSHLPPPATIKLVFGAGFQGESPPWHDLPRFHWMTSPVGTLTMVGLGAPLPANVDLSCEAVVPLKITISENGGTVLTERDLPASAIGQDVIQTIVVPIRSPNNTRQPITISVEPSQVPPPGWPGLLLCTSAVNSTGS